MIFNQSLRNSTRFALLASLACIFHKVVPTILMYHSISDDGAFFSVSSHAFDRQLSWLKKAGHQFFTLDALFQQLHAGTNVLHNAVFVTFDDGYRNNLDQALPILEKHQVPATIYVCSDFVENGRSDKGIPICNQSELQRLANHPLITIGGHTKSHPKLSKLSNDDALEEMILGKNALEIMIGKRIYHFAYPKGDYSFATTKLVSQAGFATAVTVNAGSVNPSDFPYALKRVPVDQGLPFPLFKYSCREVMGRYAHFRSLFSGMYP